MLIHYHLGLVGIGHFYARNTFKSSSTSDGPSDTENDPDLDNTSDSENANDTYELDNCAWMMEDGWDNVAVTWISPVKKAQRMMIRDAGC